jgi:hypothetical protein
VRLVLVHGINNENRSPADIERIWMDALFAAWTRDGLRAPEGLAVTTAYYADELARLSRSAADAVTAGNARVASQIAFELLQEYAQGTGLTDEHIALAAQDAGGNLDLVQEGLPHEAWVIALSRALERLLPTEGKYLARLFLRQAAVYLERKGVQTAIKNIVRAQIFVDGGPMVVVAHSLGTVVSYELLLEQRSRDLRVPLFCTLGSPLGVRIVSEHLGPRTAFPKPPIGRWLNAFHREDFVALGRTWVGQSDRGSQPAVCVQAPPQCFLVLGAGGQESNN